MKKLQGEDAEYNMENFTSFWKSVFKIEDFDLEEIGRDMSEINQFLEKKNPEKYERDMNKLMNGELYNDNKDAPRFGVCFFLMFF